MTQNNVNINNTNINDDDELKRTFFELNNEDVNLVVAALGLIIYIIIFAILIPYLLVKNKMYDLLAAYFPNLDILATVLGYMGGPPNKYLKDLWLYLYNPANFKLFGFFSTNLINYLALLGLTFTVAYTTYKTKSISKGWSRAFFMIIITYLIPGHFIIKYQDEFGKMLASKINNDMLIYLIIVGLGLVIAGGIIGLEDVLIKNFSPYVANIIRTIGKQLSLDL